MNQKINDSPEMLTVRANLKQVYKFSFKRHGSNTGNSKDLKLLLLVYKAVIKPFYPCLCQERNALSLKTVSFLIRAHVQETICPWP